MRAARGAAALAALVLATGSFVAAPANVVATVVVDGDRRVVAWAQPGLLTTSAGAPHPLLLFAPGLGQTADPARGLIEQLARRGYVVAAIDDPNDAPRLAFDFSSAAAVDAFRRVAAVKVAGDARRLSAALDAMEKAPFAAKLDLRRVGALGYSFGGAVAAEAGLDDRRIAAVVNLDGWLFGRAAEETAGPPYLLVSSDEPLGEADSAQPARAAFNRSDLAAQIARGRGVLAPGARHEDLLRPPSGLRGWLRPVAADRLAAEAAARFFDAALRGGPPFEAPVGLRPLSELRP